MLIIKAPSITATLNKELISNEVNIQYCATEDNFANIITKVLLKLKHEELVKQIGMA
jgi:hypothetical protein